MPQRECAFSTAARGAHQRGDAADERVGGEHQHHGEPDRPWLRDGEQPNRIATTPRNTTQPHRDDKPSSAFSDSMVQPPAYLRRWGRRRCEDRRRVGQRLVSRLWRRLRADRLLPEHDLAVAVGDERHAAVVGDRRWRGRAGDRGRSGRRRGGGCRRSRCRRARARALRCRGRARRAAGAASSADTSAPKPSSAKRLSSTTAPSMAARLAITRLISKTACSSFSRSGLVSPREVGPVDRRLRRRRRRAARGSARATSGSDATARPGRSGT